VRTLVFLDLDDTLFQSRRKCPADAEDLELAACLQGGIPHSFTTAKQRALWRLLDGNATVIPTTARDLDALRRVALPFRSWCILDYGGILLDPLGEPDPVWWQRMRGVTEASIGDLQSLAAAVERYIRTEGLSAQVRIVEDLGLPFYLVAKYQAERPQDLDRLQSELVQPWVEAHTPDYRLHRNGNNLAVLPGGLGKEYAVRHLIERLSCEGGEVLSIGIGDSLIDGTFMAECDYAVTPRGTQLFDATLGRWLA